MSRWIRTVAVGAAAVIAQVGLASMPAPAQSPAATITRINPVSGTAGLSVAVDGTGCVTPSGQPTTTAQLFVRGPGASTRTSPATTGLGPTQFAVGLANGAFLGLVQIPPDASTGSTYRLSAQCISQGQPQGPESAGVVFTVTGPAPSPGFDTGTGTGNPNGTSSTTGSVTGGAASPGLDTTTGRARPIPARPRFTG